MMEITKENKKKDNFFLYENVFPHSKQKQNLEHLKLLFG